MPLGHNNIDQIFSWNKKAGATLDTKEPWNEMTGNNMAKVISKQILMHFLKSLRWMKDGRVWSCGVFLMHKVEFFSSKK